jgi:signal peptidase I
MGLLSGGDACRVPAGRVFVMGDNRGRSMDSRVFGPVKEDKLVGRAFLLIWPPRHMGTL